MAVISFSDLVVFPLNFQETDSFEFLATARTAVTENCEIAIVTNVDLWIEGDDGGVELPAVIEKLCEDNCNNRGKCENGKYSTFLPLYLAYCPRSYTN